MGYSGVKGGMDAILAAERLVRRKRAAAPWSPAAAIIESYRLAVDRIMGEAGLYDEAIAADAFRQAEGDRSKRRTWCAPTGRRSPGSRSPRRPTRTR